MKEHSYWKLVPIIIFLIGMIVLLILSLTSYACEENNPPAKPGGIEIEAVAEGPQHNGGHESGVTKGGDAK